MLWKDRKSILFLLLIHQPEQGELAKCKVKRIDIYQEIEFLCRNNNNKKPQGASWVAVDGSVKSAGPLCCHTQVGNNQAHRTKCLWQDVETISTGMLFIKSLKYNPPDISSYLLDLKLFTDSMQLVLTATCYNFGLITIKSSLLGRKTLTLIQRPPYSFGNDCLVKD